MIYTKDDFLDEELFKYVEDFIKKSKWEKITIGNKDDYNFEIKYIEPEASFINYMQIWLGIIERADVEILRSFFRKSNDKFDTDWRIHNDSIVDGVQPDRAVVFYITENNMKKQNGTAFWSHKKHGYKFEDLSIEEFNKLIREDSNNIKKWKLESIINHRKNRIISYPCNYFHSKYPDKVKDRTVFVAFYLSKTYENAEQEIE
tara:strand:+ start:4997 stop:5605 length:609 start_codon:yes stop_codon:yes gene_type:complete